MSVIFVDIAALMWIALWFYIFYTLREVNKELNASLKEIKEIEGEINK